MSGPDPHVGPDGTTGGPPLEEGAQWAELGSVRVQVGPGVFVPQRDSLALVQWCGELVRGIPHPVIADLCTGSGVIALALASVQPASTVYAVDNSREAVRWAISNVYQQSQERAVDVWVRRGDATDPAVLVDIAGVTDLVVANPPYLPEGSTVAPDLTRWAEPAALFGGPDGLDVVRGVIAVAATILRAGGWLALEHAAGQDHDVVSLIEGTKVFGAISSRRDHGGTPRFVTARRTV